MTKPIYPAETGHIAHSSLDVSHPGRRIQRFLLIQLKPKHHRLDVLTHVTVCIFHAELQGYLLTYLPRVKRLGAKRPGGELTRSETSINP